MSHLNCVREAMDNKNLPISEETIMFVRSLLVGFAAATLSLISVPALASDTISALNKAVETENWSLAITLVDRLMVEKGTSEELSSYRTLLTRLDSRPSTIASADRMSLEAAIAEQNWASAIRAIDRIMNERGTSDELLAYRSRLESLNAGLVRTGQAIEEPQLSPQEQERQAFLAAREKRLTARVENQQRRNLERIMRAEERYWRIRTRGTTRLVRPTIISRGVPYVVRFYR